MSELISGKEAKIAWAKGLAVQVDIGGGVFGDITNDDLLSIFDYTTSKFRLKPRTITINGIEVPSPFEPEIGDNFYYITAGCEGGCSFRRLHDDTPEYLFSIGAWRTEEEIKQVVAALRSIFGKK